MKNTLKLTLILVIVGLTSCEYIQKSTTDLQVKLAAQTPPQKENKAEIALKFINAYVENINKGDKQVGIVKWTNASSLATKNFKQELKKIYDEVYKELGYIDADPILNAQDWPDQGFELDWLDEETNYLVVKGINDWAVDFKVTMKLKNENGNWLVDGCGMVNIPDDKISK